MDLPQPRISVVSHSQTLARRLSFLCRVWLRETRILGSLASQPLFLRGGARGGGREKESGDLSQHFVTQWNAINCNK